MLLALVVGDVSLTALSVSSRSVTLPSTSAIFARPFGLRASNSSTTRGRPWVMSETGNTAGVEGPHRELRARLADRLRGDDPDSVDLRGTSRGHQARAVSADPGLGLTEHRADRDLDVLVVLEEPSAMSWTSSQSISWFRLSSSRPRLVVELLRGHPADQVQVELPVVAVKSISMWSRVLQSSIRTITSCATSTRRLSVARSAVRSAVSASPSGAGRR